MKKILTIKLKERKKNKEKILILNNFETKLVQKAK